MTTSHGEPIWIRAWKQHDGLRIDAGTVDVRLRETNLGLIPTTALFPTTIAEFATKLDGIGRSGIHATRSSDSSYPGGGDAPEREEISMVIANATVVAPGDAGIRSRSDAVLIMDLHALVRDFAVYLSATPSKYLVLRIQQHESYMDRPLSIHPS